MVKPRRGEPRLSQEQIDVLSDILESVGHPEPDPRLVDWTYEEFERYMIAEKRHKIRTRDGKPSTVPNRMRYLRYLDNHPVAPVALRPPCKDSWLDHIHHQRTTGHYPNTTYNHYKKTMVGFLEFLEIPVWSCLQARTPDEQPHREIPPDDLVPYFWHDLRHPDKHVKLTIEHAMHLGFNIGIRPPSEHVWIDVDKIEWDARCVRFWSEKKNKYRVMHLPTYLITGRNSKSLWNYVHHVRPAVDQGLSDALYLTRRGKRWDSQVFRSTMSDLGKQVWDAFYPYCTRHWFATTFLQDNDYSIYKTAEALDDTVKVAEGYLNQARIREALKKEGARGYVKRRRRVARPVSTRSTGTQGTSDNCI